jgi:predicted MFS family arabinose efflux permease
MTSSTPSGVDAQPALCSGVADSSGALPLTGLLTLATAAFITLTTEIIPAGLLTSMAQGLGISESLAGQFITAYACGALIAAIPLTALTRGARRRTLLVAAIAGFAVVNLVTALSSEYLISLMARFVAGVFGGVVWSLLAGYAVRMTPPPLHGRAIAISGAGATVALGAPVGAWLGRMVGWQGAFGVLSAMACLLVACALAILPDFPGDPKDKRPSLAEVLCLPGVRSVLVVVAAFVTAHSILYVYIEPFLRIAGLAANVSAVLFVFGLASLVGLWLVGAAVDRHLRLLTVASILVFAVAALLLGLWGWMPMTVYAAVSVWGAAFGGFAAMTQTALSRLAGDSVDTALSMYTTAWNTAVAVAGIAGGVLLDRTGPGAFAWSIIAILSASLGGVVFGMNKALRRQASCERSSLRTWRGSR